MVKKVLPCKKIPYVLAVCSLLLCFFPVGASEQEVTDSLLNELASGSTPPPSESSAAGTDEALAEELAGSSDIPAAENESVITEEELAKARLNAEVTERLFDDQAQDAADEAVPLFPDENEPAAPAPHFYTPPVYGNPLYY